MSLFYSDTPSKEPHCIYALYLPSLLQSVIVNFQFFAFVYLNFFYDVLFEKFLKPKIWKNQKALNLEMAIKSEEASSALSAVHLSSPQIAVTGGSQPL